jgi:indolepyruvate ferredoxin oxidoreductase beta subunit
MGKCSKDSVVISNNVPVMPFSVAIGKSRYPDVSTLFDLIRKQVRQLSTLNAQALAIEAGAALCANIAMLGALARSQILPIAKEAFQDTIRNKIREQFVDTNLAAFELGYTAS